MTTTADRPGTGGGTRARRPVPPRPTRRVPSVVLKYVMAASGAAMFLYLVLHMIGNLKIFFGTGALGSYSAWLRTLLEPVVPHSGVLWAIRVVLTVALVGHVWSAIVLARRARAARPVHYVHRRPVRGSYAARTMRWGGVIIALFVVYHILDLTTGTVNPNGVHGQVYDNVAADFAPSHWYATVFYALAVITIGIHIRHGLWSALQTFGRSNATTQRLLKTVALVVAVVMVVGFLSVPFAVTFGLV